MKDIYKNPVLYYILVPTLLALWPLLLTTAYIPAVEKSLQSDKKQYKKAQKQMDKILILDRGRLKLAGGKNSKITFDYPTAVDNAAESCGILPANYEFNSKPPRSSGRQKSQGAMVLLQQVDIAKFAEFLSTIQMRWANLQCEEATLTKKKGQPDTWKVNLNFKYYY